MSINDVLNSTNFGFIREIMNWIVLWAVLLFLMWFVKGKIWVWFSQEYYPKRQLLQEAREKHSFEVENDEQRVLRDISQSLMNLSVVNERVLKILESDETWKKAFIQSAMEKQRFSYDLVKPTETPT